MPFSTEKKPNNFLDKEEQYKAIERLLEKFHIQYKQTKETDNLVADYEAEKRKFQEFSQKAKNIRNNKHVPKDFKDFTTILNNNLSRKLYKLQLLSAYHLAFSQNACNFSVPGAGKTSIVYGAYAYLESLPPNDIKYVNKLFIISPLVAFGPWENEYKECFNQKPTIKKLVNLSQSERKIHYLIGEEELTFISYQSASNDIKDITKFLQRKENNVMIVLDEAHRIKNIEGKWAKAILSLAQYAKARVILTGTPAPNSYEDLYNLYEFIWSQKNIIGYPIHYLQELSKSSYIPSKQKDVNKLIDNISPFFIRIKKSDLGLPEAKFNNPIIVQMSQTQKEIYNVIEKKYMDYFEQEQNSSGFTDKLKKAKMIRLMQATININLLKKPLEEYMGCEENHFSFDDRRIMNLITSFNLEEIPPKFYAVLNIIQEIIKNSGAKGKVVIWTIFIDNIFDLQKFLEESKIKSKVLYGKIPSENEETPKGLETREKIINEFHRNDCPYKVIIANPFAVGESISLHKACHNAIYLEKNFNAAVYMQSKDRIHRYGLKKTDEINYYHILTQNTIDETIHNRLLEKEERMLEVIEQEIPLLNLDMDSEDNEAKEDIQAIIKDYYARKNS